MFLAICDEGTDVEGETTKSACTTRPYHSRWHTKAIADVITRFGIFRGCEEEESTPARSLAQHSMILPICAVNARTQVAQKIAGRSKIEAMELSDSLRLSYMHVINAIPRFVAVRYRSYPLWMLARDKKANMDVDTSLCLHFREGWLQLIQSIHSVCERVLNEKHGRHLHDSKVKCLVSQPQSHLQLVGEKT